MTNTIFALDEEEMNPMAPAAPEGDDMGGDTPEEETPAEGRLDDESGDDTEAGEAEARLQDGEEEGEKEEDAE